MVTTRTYPYVGTCDRCAEGGRRLREADPESQAWLCPACDAEIDRGIAAAADAMQVAPEVAAAGIEAFFRVTDGDQS
jgi:PHP family Zn ribbon phosphoesterase